MTHSNDFGFCLEQNMKLMGDWELKNDNIYLTLNRFCPASVCGIGGQCGSRVTFYSMLHKR